MWFLFGEVSSSSGCLGWATLFYCGTPWAFHIITFLQFCATPCQLSPSQGNLYGPCQREGEITLLLQDRDPQPTNKRARAVPAPASKPRRQPPAQPQRETPPPTNDVIATQPATVTLQRPASSTVVIPSGSVQQPTRPKKKILRSSTPRQLPSTPHQPTVATAKVVYELPEPSRLENMKQVTKIKKIKNYNFLFCMMHLQQADFKLLVTEDTTKPQGSDRVYFIKLKNHTDWIMFKGPTSRRYYKEWYDYIWFSTPGSDDIADLGDSKHLQRWTNELVYSVLREKSRLLRPGDVTKTPSSQRQYESGSTIGRQMKAAPPLVRRHRTTSPREYLCLLLLVLFRTRWHDDRVV